MNATLVMRIALVALLVAATANRRLFDIGRLTVRVDWLGTALALAIVAALLLAGRRIPRSAPLAWFVAFVAVHALSAWLNADVWPRGYRFLIVYLCALAYVLALLLLVQDRATARFAAGALVVIVAAQSVLGLAVLVSDNLRGVQDGMWVGPYYRLIMNRARGLMTEPNLFASLALTPFAIALWRWGAESRPSWPATLAVGALTAGVVAALTRIGWLLAFGLFLLWARRLRPGRRKTAFVAFTAAAVLAFIIVSELPRSWGNINESAVYWQTIRPLVRGVDTAVEGRVMELQTGALSFRQAPFLGHGPGSANRIEQYVRTLADPVRRGRGWIANGTAFVLHDTGLIGLFIAAGTAVATALACRTAARRFRDAGARLDHEALALGLAGVLVAWQATHGLWQMYGYALFGLLLALHAIARREAAAP